jgi:hypothetical protein
MEDDACEREDFELELDLLPIPQQVSMLRKMVEEAKINLILAQQLARRIAQAGEADALSREECRRFTTVVLDEIRDIRAILVLQWSASNSEREILEQLHHIFYPQTRPDGGLAYTLDAQMFHIRMGMSIDDLTCGLPEGLQRMYWQRLWDYVEANPDEPAGWRTRLGVPGPDDKSGEKDR